MKSQKTHNCLSLVKIIQSKDYSFSITYDHCSSVSFCVIMKDYSKCVKCTHCDHSHVSIFLKSLNQTYSYLTVELKTAETEHFQLAEKQCCIFV